MAGGISPCSLSTQNRRSPRRQQGKDQRPGKPSGLTCPCRNCTWIRTAIHRHTQNRTGNWNVRSPGNNRSCPGWKKIPGTIRSSLRRSRSSMRKPSTSGPTFSTSCHTVSQATMISSVLRTYLCLPSRKRCPLGSLPVTTAGGCSSGCLLIKRNGMGASSSKWGSSSHPVRLAAPVGMSIRNSSCQTGFMSVRPAGM